MNFKVDENMPSEIAAILRAAGHDAMTVIEQELGGAEDELIMDLCRREGRTLLTLDVGFADIRAYPPADGPGCLVFRLARMDRGGIVSAVWRILPLLKKETAVGTIWVIDERQVRIRKGGMTHTKQ